MKLLSLIKTFRADEDGAVTVDWVVLTAAIVGLGIAVLASVQGGVTSVGTKINTSLTGMEVQDLSGTSGTSGAADSSTN